MHTHFLFVRFALALVFAPVCRCRLATARDSRVFLISNTGRAITDLLVHLRSLAFRSLVEFLKAVHTQITDERGDVVELSSLTLVQKRKRILFTTFVAIRFALYLSLCFDASCVLFGCEIKSDDKFFGNGSKIEVTPVWVSNNRFDIAYRSLFSYSPSHSPFSTLAIIRNADSTCTALFPDDRRVLRFY